MQLRVSRVAQDIVFELGPKPVGFFKLVVASSREERMWGLVPETAVALPVVSADVLIGQVTASQLAVLQASQAAGSEEEPDYPPVSRIVYGEPPAGYRATRDAQPLVEGEKYCVLVFGSGFESTRCYFFA